MKDKAEGPFDLVDLAGQLRYTTINADTLICREGQEDWIPFRDLPEFAAARDMPIEAIARHLEKKELGELSAKSSQKALPLPWTMTAGAICLLSVAVIALIFSNTQPKTPVISAEAKLDPWVTTEDPTFSVQCPILLHKAETTDSGNYRYDGKMLGATFTILYLSVERMQQLDTVSRRRDTAVFFLKNQILAETHGSIVSECVHKNYGHQGLETSFIVPTSRFVLVPGKMRSFVTEENTFEIMVTGVPGEFSETDMNRFLDSFNPR